jgi:hypothetical protein
MTRTALRCWLAAGALAAAACGHTRSAPSKTESTGPGTEPAKQPAKPSAARKPEDQRTPPRKTGTAETPVPRTPAAALEPGQLRQIQRRLAERKLLGAHDEGTLDEPTRQALRRLQRQEDLPETGLPDSETVRKLGLDPDQVFARRRGPPGQSR